MYFFCRQKLHVDSIVFLVQWEIEREMLIHNFEMLCCITINMLKGICHKTGHFKQYTMKKCKSRDKPHDNTISESKDIGHFMQILTFPGRVELGLYSFQV